MTAIDLQNPAVAGTLLLALGVAVGLLLGLLTGWCMGRATARRNHADEGRLQTLLGPLQEQLQHLDRAVQDARSESAGKTGALAQMVEALRRQAELLGQDADNLSRALKGDTKVQGDWGEMVLEGLLEASGLQAGLHYEVQPVYTTADGRHQRPDIVVKLPGGRSIIIDAKTSLTAYAEAVAARAEEERSNALRAHLRSLNQHVRELAGKSYTALEQQSLDYVLMFVPNEGAYIEAVRCEPALITRAIEQRVLIVSPANLVMALQLAAFLWRREARDNNVENIVGEAGKMLRKFDGVCDAFATLGSALDKAQKAYETAAMRLNKGQGNLASHLDGLSRMGVTRR